MTKVPELPYNYLPDDTEPLRPPRTTTLSNNPTNNPYGSRRKSESPILQVTRVKSLVSTTMKKELQVIYRLVMISKRVYLKKRRINKVCNYTWLMTVPKASWSGAARSTRTNDQGNAHWNRLCGREAVRPISRRHQPPS